MICTNGKINTAVLVFFSTFGTHPPPHTHTCTSDVALRFVALPPPAPALLFIKLHFSFFSEGVTQPREQGLGKQRTKVLASSS